ncbi:MAG TPA: hypothetical protein VFR10_00490 [bacterium]|nr:hypothetical protein [bacterium]
MKTTSDVLETHARRLEQRVIGVGKELGTALRELMGSLPASQRGPGDLANYLQIDKVLATRVMKTLRASEPLSVIHVSPGPGPLRRVIEAAEQKRVRAATAKRARVAVDEFEKLIRAEAGDRSALQAMISAWLPDSRQEFELRRKQAAYRAMSQLIGASVETSLATVFVHPDADGNRLDVVWVFGVLGLKRHRPGTRVRLASRRIDRADAPRRPVTLNGHPVDDMVGLRLDAFSSVPPPKLEVHDGGEVIRYTLPDEGFDPNASTDLVFAEVNRAEMDSQVPADSGRSAYFFAEVTAPAVRVLFDVFVHQDVYPGADPSLAIYDTVLEGIASANDRGRDLDRLHLEESIRPLGRDLRRFRASAAPGYADLLRTVYEKLEWNPAEFRGYRCVIDYPIYGSQVTMVFPPPASPRKITRL